MKPLLKNYIRLFGINSIILSNIFLLILTFYLKKTPLITISLSLTFFLTQYDSKFLKNFPKNTKKRIQIILIQKIILPTLFLIPLIFHPKKLIIVLTLSNILSLFKIRLKSEIFSKLNFLKNKLLQKDLTLTIKKDANNIIMLSILSLSIYFEVFKESNLETGFLLSLISPLLYYLITFFDKTKNYESLPLTKKDYQISKVMTFTIITTILFFLYTKIFLKNYFINTILYLTNSYTLTNISKKWLTTLNYKNVLKYVLTVIILTLIKNVIYINPAIYLLLIAMVSKISHLIQE